MSVNTPEQLIVRYLTSEATFEEQEQLFDWVAQDKKNKRFFNECVALWSAQNQSEPVFRVAAGLKNLNSRIDEIEDASRKRSSPTASWAIAAVLALFMMAGLGVFFIGKYSRSNDISYVMKSATKQEVLTLSDASTITLNASSSLKYPEEFSDDKREVYLTGEAYFEIKRDTLRPFIVHTGNITTEVLGTSFTVKVQADKISVAVVTGSVKVSKDNRREILKPFDKITVGTQTELFLKEIADLDRELAWKDGTIIFDETPLSEAAEKIAAHYGVTIEFSNELLKKCPITGKFKNESLNNVLRAIEFSVGVQFSLKGNKVSVQGQGCK